MVAVAGPNGAGKSTFCAAHLGGLGLPIINADLLARNLDLDAYEAADIADSIRRAWAARGESFVFETVFSDPVGAKLEFLEQMSAAGYTVVLCFVGIASSEVSVQRVSMRVTQGGHDVPDEKLTARFPRVLANLKRAIRRLPHVLVYDNDDLVTPFRLVARYQHGEELFTVSPLPGWLEPRT